MAAFVADLAKAKTLDEINEVVKGHVPQVSLLQSFEQLAAVHQTGPIR